MDRLATAEAGLDQLIMKALQETERRKILVNGIVQGVGFRPFVYRLARGHRLTGHVENSPAGVQIEVEGQVTEVASFLRQLHDNPPPLAVVDSISSSILPSSSDTDFTIHASEHHGRIITQISPDMAVCDDCIGELHDPNNRRYRYPFINCTNCGPRYTIIENIPYDRPATSMRSFTMCPDCQAEYDDPENRRYHAQPNCCPICGPQLSLTDPQGEVIAEPAEAVTKAIDLLLTGHILAIKGLGGFHLAVDASNDGAVERLREKKGREEKPLAIMVANLHTATQICTLGRQEEATLISPRRPILLAVKKKNKKLSPRLAPGNDRLGIMLPYTPLHHLLFDGRISALVMTSGNLSEEPICIDNTEARQRLASLADFFLCHNRDIYLRNDDSVVIQMGNRLRTVRRSRGYAPRPIPFHLPGTQVLAMGGELKNTICLLKNEQAILSQHIGDLKNLESYSSFQKTIAHLRLLFDSAPELVVHDLHPGYLSSRWALEQTEFPTLAVQHHHAHLAACLAENNSADPAIGLIMDGTGYGEDGTIWGGEVLIGDFHDYQRFAAFEPMPLPGGDAAIAAPWRTAVGYLVASYGNKLPALAFLDAHSPEIILEMIAKKINTPWTSSCGRLFDAVAVLAGGRPEIRYEAQSAIEFMQASQHFDAEPYPYEILVTENGRRLSVQAIIKAVVADRLSGASQATIGQRFHRTLVELFAEVAELAREETGITTVALSGGVFQNQLLFEGLLTTLTKRNFTVLTHALVPTNDGCLALGQAAIGRAYLMKNRS